MDYTCTCTNKTEGQTEIIISFEMKYYTCGIFLGKAYNLTASSNFSAQIDCTLKTISPANGS